jgi:hypothetical protein
MSESPLERAAEIYAPFDAGETARLRQYVEDVQDLAASSFFKNPGQKVTLSWSDDDRTLRTELDYAGEEAVRAVVPLFRQLYNPTEPTSYVQVLKLLSRHVKARESALQADAIEALRDLRRGQQQILTQPMGQIVMNAEELTPAALVDLFLHGHYLHKGNEKSEKLAQWPVTDLLRHSFFTTMLQLRNLYWIGRNVVLRVLAEPSLVPAAPPPRWGGSP